MSSDVSFPLPDPDPNLVMNLRLELRETSRIGRWMWELIDARDRTSFERRLGSTLLTMPGLRDSPVSPNLLHR